MTNKKAAGLEKKNLLEKAESVMMVVIFLLAFSGMKHVSIG